MMRRSRVLFREGAWTETINRPGVMSRIYAATVPKGVTFELDPYSPFLCYILARELGLTPSAAAAGVVTPTHGVAIPTAASGVAAPPGRHEVLVGQIVAGTRVRLTVTERTATTLRFAETVAAGTTIDAFYLPAAPARLQLRLEDPRFGVTVDRIQFSQDVGIFVADNPFHNNTLTGLTGSHVFPPDFLISLWLDAPYEVAWVDNTAAAAPLPALMVLPILVNTRPVDIDAFAAAVSEDLARR